MPKLKPTTTDKNLTVVVKAFRKLQQKYEGSPPTFEEVCKATGIASKATVQHYVAIGLQSGVLRKLRPGKKTVRNIVAVD